MLALVLPPGPVNPRIIINGLLQGGFGATREIGRLKNLGRPSQLDAASVCSGEFMSSTLCVLLMLMVIRITVIATILFLFPAAAVAVTQFSVCFSFSTSACTWKKANSNKKKQKQKALKVSGFRSAKREGNKKL
jgi:hypothetical protein